MSDVQKRPAAHGALSKVLGISRQAGLVGAMTLALAGCGALVHKSSPIHATYSTTVTSTSTVPTMSTPLYQNSLQRQATPAGWSTRSVCQFSAQGLVVQPSGGQAYICLAPVPALSSVVVQTTVQQLSGSPDHAFGIALRHQTPHSYYFFGIDGHGRYTFTVVTNDVSHTVIPFTVNAAIHTGVSAQNQLAVQAQGSHLTLFVNGVAVGQTTLSTFATGTIGLRGVNDGQVRFVGLTIAKA